MNSINNIKRAINFEIKRQTDLLINNQKIKHETRSYDAVSNITISMRHKERLMITDIFQNQIYFQLKFLKKI